MAQRAVKTPTNVTINRRWQLVFVVTAIGSQIVFVAVMLASIFRFTHYQSSGTWAFQITQWVYPLLYLVAGYLFARRRIKGFLSVLFWATFVTTISLTVWGIIQSVLNYLYSVFNWWPVVSAHDKSWWAAFGTTWLQMGVVFVLYCGVLGLITWRGKRR